MSSRVECSIQLRKVGEWDFMTHLTLNIMTSSVGGCLPLQA